MQDGKPVANASITFYPASGRPSAGTSDGEGKFELEYTKGKMGAVVGEHTVKIFTGGMPAPPAPGMSSSSGSRRPPKTTPPTEVVLPSKVMVESGTNRMDLEIPSQP